MVNKGRPLITASIRPMTGIYYAALYVRSGVKLGSVPACTARPLYPQEQTSSGRPGTSVSCHQQTWRSSHQADHILEMSLTGHSRRFDRAPNISVSFVT